MRFMEAVYTMSAKLLGRDAKAEAAKRQVLRAFKDMGATRQDLAAEKTRLSSDQKYLSDWHQVICYAAEDSEGNLRGSA